MNCCQRNLTAVAPAKAAVVCSHLYNAGAAWLKVSMRMLGGESGGGDSLRRWRELACWQPVRIQQTKG